MDDPSRERFETVRDGLEAETTVMTAVESPNGFHLITEPFNYPDADVTDPDDVEVKTDGLLFLHLL